MHDVEPGSYVACAVVDRADRIRCRPTLVVDGEDVREIVLDAR